jgi:cytosine/adenosine deaminase-related metal-dependent hydrolase
MQPITNAHTHLELTTMARLCPAQPTSFVTWLGRVGWQLSHMSVEDLRAGIGQGIAELQACGTTQVGDVTNSWLSFEPLSHSGLSGIVYLEVLGQHKARALERLEAAKIEISRMRRLPGYGPLQVGLSLHAPYSCHPELLRAGAAWCRAEGVPLCVHVAESEAETELLLNGVISSLGRAPTTLAQLAGILPASVPHMRPLPYLASLGVLEAHPLLVHAVQVTDEDIRLIAEAGCAAVHCPRSNHLLSCGRMPLERYLAAGVSVYLGTDSRASSPDLDVRAEAEFACRLHAGVVRPEQVTRLAHRSLNHAP